MLGEAAEGDRLQRIEGAGVHMSFTQGQAFFEVGSGAGL